MAYKKTVPEKVTSILSLTSLPSETNCKFLLKKCKEDGYVAVSSKNSVFTMESLKSIIKIHELSDIKSRVKREEKWIRDMQVSIPSPECSFNPCDLKSYSNLIFQNSDGKCVLKNQPFILASDLASLAGQRWLTHSVLAGLVNNIQNDAYGVTPFMLSDLLMMEEEARKTYLLQKITRHTKGVAFIVNVGKTNGNIFTCSPKSKPGCHWTLLFVDILKPIANCWNMPNDLSLLVTPIVRVVFESNGSPFQQ